MLNNKTSLSQIKHKKLKVLEEGLNAQLPDLLKAGYEIGKSQGNEDSFFDSIAQILSVLRTDKNHDAASLRNICSDLIIKNKDYKSLIQKKRTLDDQQYINYLTILRLTADEVNARKMGKPVWGLPDAEGVVLCKELQLKMYFIDAFVEEDFCDVSGMKFDEKSDKFEATSFDIFPENKDVIYILRAYDQYFPIFTQEQVELREKLIKEQEKKDDNLLRQTQNVKATSSHPSLPLPPLDISPPPSPSSAPSIEHPDYYDSGNFAPIDWAEGTADHSSGVFFVNQANIGNPVTLELVLLEQAFKNATNQITHTETTHNYLCGSEISTQEVDSIKIKNIFSDLTKTIKPNLFHELLNTIENSTEENCLLKALSHEDIFQPQKTNDETFAHFSSNLNVFLQKLITTQEIDFELKTKLIFSEDEMNHFLLPHYNNNEINPERVVTIYQCLDEFRNKYSLKISIEEPPSKKQKLSPGNSN